MRVGKCTYMHIHALKHTEREPAEVVQQLQEDLITANTKIQVLSSNAVTLQEECKQLRKALSEAQSKLAEVCSFPIKVMSFLFEWNTHASSRTHV
jgi:hypothetical protein